MNWYLVKLIFLVKQGEHAHAPRFDEQWRSIRADEVAWAYEKSAVLGRLEETNFLNDRAEAVDYKFIEVGEIHQISSMEDGEALFSVTLEPINADTYIEEVKLKSQRSFDHAKSREVTSMGRFNI